MNQADRMVHIIQHVRLFAREAGKPNRLPLQVNDVVLSALDMLSAQFRSHGIDLQTELTENLPDVSGNSFSLEEVILNLLNNARDAIEDHHPESGHIRIRTGMAGTHVLIDMADNGGGIPTEILDRIFDPFFTTKDPDKGTGLGFSVSRSIVEEFGGQIEVNSQTKQGTTIRITLPALQNTPPEITS
jgi:C4-dicarboxylate-specific signal transduction histidine kinase